MARDLFAFKCLPQTDDLDDALCLVAGQLQMVLQGVCRAVPVAGQSRIQNFQMLMLTLPVMMRKRVFRPVMRS